MNKKLLLGAALMLGMGVSFTSCVDDSESESVIKVRNAKADQLKSIAELNSANAQAALILANAEKAAKEAAATLAEAQAAEAQARAAKAAAEAAEIAARTEADKAKAQQDAQLAAIELQKQQLLLQEAQKQLEAKLAELDAAIEKSKYDAINWQQKLAGLVKGENDAKATELQNLINTYETTSKSLITIKRKLAAKNLELIGLESGLVSTQETIQRSIAKLEEDNAEQAATIAANKAIIETYSKYTGKTVTAEDVAAAKVAMVDANAAYTEAKEAYYEKNDEYNTANSALLYSDYVNEVINKFTYNRTGSNNLVGWNDSYSVWDEISQRTNTYSLKIQFFATYNNNVPEENKGKWNVVINEPNNKVTYIPVFEDIAYKGMKYEYQQDGESKTYSYYNYESYLNLINEGEGIKELISFMEAKRAGTIQSCNNQVEYLTKTLAEAKETEAKAQTAYDKAAGEYTTAQGVTKGLKSKYNDAVKNEETALKAWEKAKELANKADATEAQKADVAVKKAEYDKAVAATSDALNKYNEARTKESEAYNARYEAVTTLNNAQYNVNYYTQNLTYYTNRAAQYVNDLADLKENYAKVLDLAAEGDENLEAYNTANDAKVVATVNSNIKWDDYTAANTEYTNLNNALTNNNGVLGGNSTANAEIKNANKAIQDAEDAIKDNNKKIANKQAKLAAIAAGQDDDSEEIAELKALIEKLEVELAAAQQRYDIAKAELEAAVKAE